MITIRSEEPLESPRMEQIWNQTRLHGLHIAVRNRIDAVEEKTPTFTRETTSPKGERDIERLLEREETLSGKGTSTKPPDKDAGKDGSTNVTDKKLSPLLLTDEDASGKVTLGRGNEEAKQRRDAWESDGDETLRGGGTPQNGTTAQRGDIEIPENENLEEKKQK